MSFISSPFAEDAHTSSSLSALNARKSSAPGGNATPASLKSCFTVSVLAAIAWRDRSSPGGALDTHSVGIRIGRAFGRGEGLTVLEGGACVCSTTFVVAGGSGFRAHGALFVPSLHALSKGLGCTSVSTRTGAGAVGPHDRVT